MAAITITYKLNGMFPIIIKERRPYKNVATKLMVKLRYTT